ncbi:MAG: hypothetical protein FWE35_07540 [Streptosporangiales bacterium]|nr:hypothetical protein [Streptosporangiales bacterium]
MELSECPTCRVCRGPVLPGYALCYQCDQARQVAGGLLADAVAPVAYAVKGGDLARDLWRYKSERDRDDQAAARLREMLASFLVTYGDRVWKAARMPGKPRGLAVVPSGQGRPGSHPLLALAEPAAALPVISLSVRAGHAVHGRYVSTDWLRVDGRVQIAGADMLLIDDSWVSGASAQSAAAALKLAGAARVATIVLGRHLDPADPRSATLVRALS